ncbi:3-deoxy-manno-octulosonate-8-phosphatase KdsC [Marinobacter fonticola]|uniref:3-deoxy-manno-octulosonate-8-phosphatase KdsC n=1 Tax=Marinobacter fonticola TaxID=2603215 RepID=UPI0011E7577C|nr:3-deoxy-manno-octulosonate-8-phosphatase KdsC [Marinobacter fonticola]
MERPLPDDLITKAASIRLLALDVDGIMTDGRLYFTAQGDELKAFNILDGHGIKQLRRSGIEVAVITGRSSPLTARRARDLGIQHVYQGREDKEAALRELLSELNISNEAAAYMGDDLPDLGAIMLAGLGISVPNGHWYVREQADYCTEAAGGEGAVREICDLILQAQNKLADLHLTYHSGGATDGA